MHIKINLTADDMAAFNIYFLQHSRVYLRFMFLCFIIFSPSFPASLILLDQIIPLETDIPLIAKIVVGLATAVGVIVALHFLLPFRLADLIRSLYNDSHHKKLLGEIEFQIDEAGIRKKGEYSESLTDWRGIQKIRKTDDYGFLFIAHNSAHIIPRRCLTPEEFEEFMAKANEYWLIANPSTKTGP